MVFFKELTVIAADVTGGPLTNFPLLVSITDSDLQKNARADGFDIFFTKSDETTVIPYDRESYDSTTGELIAWVLVDLSDTADNKIFMFYGNPNDEADQQNPLPVWNTRFQDVFHFNQTSPLPWLNSSVGKNFTFNPLGPTMPTPLTGEIHTASDHDIAAIIEDTIAFRMPNSIDVTPTDFFISAWVKYDTIPNRVNTLILNWSSNLPIPASLSNVTITSFPHPNNNLIGFGISDAGGAVLLGNMLDLEFHHVAIRYLSGTFDFFFDGIFDSSFPFTFTDPPSFNAAQCGGGILGAVTQSARIDQLQVAYNGNFTNGFITTSFDNQKTAGQGAGNFVKVGGQEQNTISNNYLLLSQGALGESGSIINAVCGDSSLLIGETVRLLPVGTGEGFTQPNDLLPRVGGVEGTASYGIIVGGDFEGVYSEGEIKFDSNNLAQELIASFFGDGVRVCTQGRCLAFADGTSIINIGDRLTSSTNGLVKASVTDRVIAIALQSTIPVADTDNMLYEDLEIMQYEDLINMIYELSLLPHKNSIIAVDVQREIAQHVSMIYNNTGEVMLYNNTGEIMLYNG